ncbi:SWIM zinc finger family protein [Streptomyces sp. HPF1205]|uniref:SWIM zinc finger family protein n=1 Tax=Streptomyces sp. HPF1205 TaxID=2873262 RepID=UPI001CEC5C9B|nr:SWIM zinc finger family protein [Streptomyces sp. HPF1205]
MATTPETRCTKCRRRLRKPSPDGYGPKCRAKVRRAGRRPEIGQYKPHLVEKAIELLEQGGLIPLRKSSKNSVFLAVSSDGTTTYKTAPAACTCPAGLRAAYDCKHRIAAHIVTLTA